MNTKVVGYDRKIIELFVVLSSRNSYVALLCCNGYVALYQRLCCFVATVMLLYGNGYVCNGYVALYQRLCCFVATVM